MVFLSVICMKYYIIFFSLFFSALTFAQQDAEVSAESTTAVNEQTVDPNEILAGIRKDLTGIKAEFIQYELLNNNQKADLNSGQVYMQAPAQFRWNYREPVEQLIVADGANVWVYDEDLEQVTVKQQDNQLNPIYVIIDDEKSQQHYNIKHEVRTNGMDWISLTPKQANEEVKTVWLAVKDHMVKQIKVENQFQQTMVFEFHDIERNPKFATDWFKFIPPEGVDVVKAIDPGSAEL